MTKPIQKEFREIRKEIVTMSNSVEKAKMNDTIECLNFSKISTLKNIYKKILPVIQKHNGIVYGTTIGASINNSKIAVRQTDDLDVKFKSEKDRKAFVEDVMKALGTKYYFVKNGYYGEKICRKRDKKTIIDTHVIEKGWNKKNKGKYIIATSQYAKLGTKDKKIKEYCNTKGESYSVSAQAKYNAILADLSEGHKKDNPVAQDKLKRVGKDAFDIRLYNSDTYTKVYKMWVKEKDPKKKAELNRLLNKLGRAILSFSARPEIYKNRVKMEEEYIRSGMLSKATFTNENRQNLERALYRRVKQNPQLDITKYGTEWLEAKAITKKYNKFDFDIENMF